MSTDDLVEKMAAAPLYAALGREGNGTIQNRFLNLDNFFICLAYDDLMVGISNGGNCF